MNITIESVRVVKPTYNGNAPSTNHHVRLSVFDKVTCDMHIAIIYAFHPPTPSNIAIEEGLSKVLAIGAYRELAGRLGKDLEGNSVIFLNDQGVRFVEATVNAKLRDVLPSMPTKVTLGLHPNLHNAEEVALVQLTRFACGSLVVGFASSHIVTDAQTASNFLVAWGLVTRGIYIDPIPLHTRDILFKPREPPVVQYDHDKTEYMSKKYTETMPITGNKLNEEEIILHKVHFTNDFINKLRAKDSTGVPKTYSRFEIILAHLWRGITKARGLQGHEITQIRISVNGRKRMDPKVPNEFSGNVVLWAFPRSNVRDLINQPLRYTAELIHAEVGKVNNSYFKSFIDFASSDIVSNEGLVSTSVTNKRIYSPDLEVESWLNFPFYDLDFGNGSPYYFMPPYFDTEGILVFLPSYMKDGSIDVIVSLLVDNLATFIKNCHSLD